MWIADLQNKSNTVPRNPLNIKKWNLGCFRYRTRGLSGAVWCRARGFHCKEQRNEDGDQRKDVQHFQIKPLTSAPTASNGLSNGNKLTERISESTYNLINIIF